MNIDITPVIQAVIALIAAFITARIIPYIKERTSNEQQNMLMAAVKVAVYAAEEIYKAGHGDEKLRFAQQYLAQKGFTVDAATIKSVVYQMRGQLGINQSESANEDGNTA